VLSEVMPLIVLQMKSIPFEQRQTIQDQIDWLALRNTWESLRRSRQFLDSIKGYLAIRASTPVDERPQEDFSIAAGEKRIFSTSLSVTTRHLLVVTLGGRKTEHSVRLITLNPGQKNIRLCINHFDVYQYQPDGPCGLAVQREPR